MASDVSIRRAKVNDQDALALVGQATFLETFSGVLDGSAIIEHCRHAHSAARYLAWLNDPDAAIWLAEASPGHSPVGYIVVARPELPMADLERDVELKRIYLLGRYHGVGVGKRLLIHAIEHAKLLGATRLLLGVYAGNVSAIGFYRQQGFLDFTRRRFNVGGRDYDDQVMSLTLVER
ncbi:GNAT family N-acetyltransferase [Noviherbaspirillum galbum]|uniref:GNAT family N-acetyltransferase n=1 Tax=Noviherbaspirillum galbum TaxID=2709383 RepID=A0A6B3SML6_9BURK|nr:GNAT family N-acetyltransferase [Noviherbaspirillum galbum]NEX62094.1 GNAT family N-acetyltransferase [Noviherbaspirillum galbum]